jgi:hypothetical protein
MQSRRKWAIVLTSIAAAFASSTLLPSPATAAQAAIVVCDSFPAPSISASGGIITAHYFHSCNSISGVNDMTGAIYICKSDGTVCDGRVVVDMPQTTAAGTHNIPVGSNHGHWFADEVFLFSGSFTSGPAPHGGCGRIAGTDTVRCEWQSAPIFA